MKKRLLSILLMCCMVLTLLPTAAFAEGSTEELPVCTCETACMAESMNDDCSVCGAEGASAENCAKYADSVNGEGSGTGTSRQALTNVAITFPTPEAGKPVGDGSAVSANADSGLTLYLFGPALWKQGEEPDKLDENAAYAEGNTYLLNFTFYTQKPITDETVLTYNGKPITRYADYQALTEALDAYDGKQDAYLGCVLFSAEGTGDPAMEDLKDLYLLSLYAFVRVPEAQIPEDTVDEQFTLTPGGRYYFDLSAMNIPGTANGGNSDGAVSLPDTSLHYVPFTYVGTIEAYKLTSATATTEEYAQQNKYPHSLFVADYAVTHTISWGGLNDEGLIFGKNYASGGVDYTLRAPSVGSISTGSGDSQRGVPQSNEWDTMLNKNSGYIQNWNKMYSWGQDTSSAAESFRAYRGYNSARFWYYTSSSFRNVYLGFRPVLEVLNPGTLGSDGLKVVTLDLGGGKLGNSSEDIQIIVKTGSEFTAPASDGLTRPDGDAGSFFMWLGSNGKFYAPGDSVPAEVTKLTAQWTAPTYAVTLNTNGGTINSGNVTSYTYGVGATLPTAGDMTYTGHTFVGWYDNENLTGSPVTAIGGTETGNKEYWAKWEANAYTVTLNTNGGTINNGNVTSYTYGVGATLPTDVTRTGYTFKGWYDNEGLTGNPVTAISNTETGNKEYWAKWEINQYTITFDTAGGSVVTPITQNYGTAITAPADPTKNGYTFVGWNPEIPATMPAKDLTVTAQWTLDLYTISYNLNNGTATGNPDSYTVESDAITLNTPTRPGYTFTGWSGTGLDGENNMTVTIPTGSTGNRTYTAHWRYNGSGHSYSYYTIKATAGAGGSISPSGNVSVREGRDQTFTITPDKGYAVANVKIDGKSIGAVKSYTFENVRRTHTIEVIFMKANGNPQTGVFVDVATGSYYEDAVDWAVENGITKGTDDTHFSPDGICTRAQAVTFLWRAAGSPKPETRTMPFTDVPAGSYYYDAVLWAVENGITKGTSDTTFSPNMTCTRAQIVTFLWRSEKSPAAGTANPFADVKSTAYYAGAVLWAVREDITKGTTSTTFSPDADCTRAQIVTFLWRCKK